MSKIFKNQQGSHVIGIAVAIVVLGLIGFGGYRVLTKGKFGKSEGGLSKQEKQRTEGGVQLQYATDPVQKGKYLSHDNCEGTGSKQLGSAPMRTSDVSTILPYGLMVGGHVTPVDHQYYYAKNQKAAPSTYDVLAPADGKLVSIEVRPRGTGPSDVRGVISYSCTFFSYFDLANSLSSEIAAQMPTGWQTKNGPQKVAITVKQGQIIAKVGGQSLDFAVWDTTKIQNKLLVVKAYSNYEPWKVNTVSPLDYYTSSVKQSVLPLYVRTAEPRDGKLAYDIDGKAVGSWFKDGTNGYIGAFRESTYNPMTYADGHLALAPDYLDPSGWVLSTGALNHGKQYAIKAPSVAPDKLDRGSKLVKYELINYEHVDQTGSRWMGASVPQSVKMNTSGSIMATALVQLTDKRELKVEIFEGKMSSQVSGFTDKATTYTRGDEATTMMGPQSGGN